MKKAGPGLGKTSSLARDYENPMKTDNDVIEAIEKTDQLSMGFNDKISKSIAKGKKGKKVKKPTAINSDSPDKSPVMVLGHETEVKVASPVRVEAEKKLTQAQEIVRSVNLLNDLVRTYHF